MQTYFITTVYCKGQGTRRGHNGTEKYLVQRKDVSHTIIVDNGSYQLVLLEHREMLEGSGFAEDVTALQAITSCNQIIHLDSHPVIR